MELAVQAYAPSALGGAGGQRGLIFQVKAPSVAPVHLLRRIEIRLALVMERAFAVKVPPEGTANYLI